MSQNTVKGGGVILRCRYTHMLEENNMPWTYKHNPTLQIVEVAYAGVITARDLRESTSEFIALEKEKGMNQFLIDTTEMKFTGSLVDIYDLPTKQYLEEEADRHGRVAVVLSTSPREIEVVEFYETVCRNSGWMVRVFSERQEAVIWLTSGASSNKPYAGDGL